MIYCSVIWSSNCRLICCLHVKDLCILLFIKRLWPTKYQLAYFFPLGPHVQVILWPLFRCCIFWHSVQEIFHKWAFLQLCIIALSAYSLKVHIALYGNLSQSYGASLAIWDHNSVTCHPTQVNASHLNPSQPGRYLIYLRQRGGRLSWPR